VDDLDALSHGDRVDRVHVVDLFPNGGDTGSVWSRVMRVSSKAGRLGLAGVTNQPRSTTGTRPRTQA
jgi:hypothetical protein